MIKPYYETELGKLYHGDCLEILPEIPKNSIDLCLTDPPYGINAYASGVMGGGVLAKQSSYVATKWDSCTPDKEVFGFIFNHSQNQIVFGGNYFTNVLPPSPCWLVWDKGNGKNNFADCELAYTNFSTSVRKFKYKWQGMLQENAGKHKEKRYHPTQKPVGLFMQILQSYAKSDWTILDPFAGSGTTGIACERLSNMNLSYTLIEREEKYCEIAAKRLEQETQQLKLF